MLKSFIQEPYRVEGKGYILHTQEKTLGEERVRILGITNQIDCRRSLGTFVIFSFMSSITNAL